MELRGCGRFCVGVSSRRLLVVQQTINSFPGTSKKSKGEKKEKGGPSIDGRKENVAANHVFGGGTVHRPSARGGLLSERGG